ncbi:MAG: C25 family cysteine peptidase, partial [Candidatus Electryoneaceae bacterium]|nr:C25 family cysteine peptidase [Candidatus Electryoneaceae bacterium]
MIFLLVVMLIPAILSASSPDNPVSSTEYIPTTTVDVIHSASYDLTVEYNTPQWDGTVDDDILPTITRWIAMPLNGEITIENISTQSEYDTDGLLEIGQPILMRGIKLVPVLFHPIVRDQNGEAYVVNQTTVDLKLSAELPPLNELGRAIRTMWGNLLLNRDDPRRDWPQGDASATYIYVVPDDDRVREIMEPLYLLRSLEGFTVRELTSFGNNANFVKEQILLYHQDPDIPPVEYVCMVGDDGGPFSVPSMMRGSSDYPYVQLEGDDDPYPEAAVGRLSYNSIAELQRIVDKILTYEQEPDFEDAGWLRRGAVAAGNRISGRSTILVSQWVRDLMLDREFTSVDTFWWTMGGGVANFMRRTFDREVSFVNYRGWTGLEDWSPQDAQRLTNDYFPIALLLACNTGDFSGGVLGFSEALLRAEGGAIGAIGCAGAQGRVNFNNAMMAGFYRGVFDDEPVRLGWMLNRAKLELLALYGPYAGKTALNHCYWTNLMGDPATVIWMDVPQEASIGIPEEVDFGDGELVVSVTGANEEPLAGVRVGFHKPDDFTAAAYSDEDGEAIIALDPRQLTAGTGYVTVSGSQVLIHTEEIELVQPEALVVYESYRIQDDDFEPRHGNSDGFPNPNETIGIYLLLHNIGAEEINGLNVTLEIEEDVCTIIQDFYMHGVPVGPGDMFQAQFVVRLEPNFPD